MAAEWILQPDQVGLNGVHCLTTDRLTEDVRLDNPVQGFDNADCGRSEAPRALVRDLHRCNRRCKSRSRLGAGERCIRRHERIAVRAVGESDLRGERVYQNLFGLWVDAIKAKAHRAFQSLAFQAAVPILIGFGKNMHFASHFLLKRDSH